MSLKTIMKSSGKIDESLIPESLAGLNMESGVLIHLKTEMLETKDIKRKMII